MKKSRLRSFASLGLVVAAFVMPTMAFADDPPPPPPPPPPDGPTGGYAYFNDGNGTCGYAQQTPYGWQVIMTFNCPREVGTG
jgi:hypothetical protein